LSTQIPNLPVVEISAADNIDVMPQVVTAASKFTAAGSVVLLAPAAASMDQFKDYADRGNQFAEAVRAHLETA
jgi:UDP-N-acetylmuramoylalanine--D-glutamate ligase